MKRRKKDELTTANHLDMLKNEEADDAGREYTISIWMSMGCTRAEAESKVIPKSKKQAQT
jgi:hypothetical protein